MKFLPYLYAVLLLLSVSVAGCTPSSGTDNPELVRLDSLLARKDEFENEKLMRINEIRRNGRRDVTADDRFATASKLFEEFSIYNSDSAIKYADSMCAIARFSGNKQRETQSLIRKSSLLTSTGLLRESEDIMNGISPVGLDTATLIEYYGQMIYLQSHLGNYAGGDGNDHYLCERLYKDSIMQIITPAHPEYLWFRSWDIIGTDKNDTTLIPALEAKLASSSLDNRLDAKEAYVLARLYYEAGDMERYLSAMIMSAIVDVKIANAEIASLDELGRYVFDNGNGDIDRAYRYVNYGLNKAICFPDRVRAFSITSLLDSVNKVYQERNRREKARSERALWCVCVLAVILISAIAVIIMQNKRLRRQGANLDRANKKLNANVTELSDAQKQLHEVNNRLKELNADLQQKNEELHESNYVKEEYIGNIFTICSGYITKLDEMRSSIHAKALAKKYREILDDTDNSSDRMRDELKEFYRSFDSVFLHIYPDFVSDFNALLMPDKAIVPKEGELLNTELRIYAMVRLGITDSIKIAEFLHCSPQTVYNYRFKVRNRAVVPKKDFAETVRRLGKFNDIPS